MTISGIGGEQHDAPLTFRRITVMFFLLGGFLNIAEDVDKLTGF